MYQTVVRTTNEFDRLTLDKWYSI